MCDGPVRRVYAQTRAQCTNIRGGRAIRGEADDGRRQDAAAMSPCCAFSTTCASSQRRLPASRAFSSLGSPSHHPPNSPSAGAHVALLIAYSFLRVLFGTEYRDRLFCSSLRTNLLHAYTIKGDINFRGNTTPGLLDPVGPWPLTLCEYVLLKKIAGRASGLDSYKLRLDSVLNPLLGAVFRMVSVQQLQHGVFPIASLQKCVPVRSHKWAPTTPSSHAVNRLPCSCTFSHA
ncbi:hypothetical protein PENSPDRAFT_458460 [Peniophora sp. CONT]|nr:hypothetical protein PENSPDRAFT_458460 [Peniophora sp. CONT]